MSDSGEPRIAIVHDELTRRGGAEVVLEEMIRAFPEADVFALYASSPQITVDGRARQVKTSFLQKLPVWLRRHPSRVLPLLPYAAEQLDLSEYDAVLSSSSGFAKAVVTRARIPHVSYCHTPTRYLWEDVRRNSGASQWKAAVAEPLLHYLRMTDFAAAQRVDYFFANSEYTRQRIRSIYRKESSVIYPPVDTAFFTPPAAAHLERKYFLCVGRLTPSKQFNQAIEVCEKLELPLVIVGGGHDLPRLKRLAGKYTKFAGKVSREELRLHYWMANAVIQPGAEDFGIATAEALASGTPVIAYGRGGVREVVRHGETGYLYNHQKPEGLAEAMRRFISGRNQWKAGSLQQSVLKFGGSGFREGLRKEVEKAIEEQSCLSV